MKKQKSKKSCHFIASGDEQATIHPLTNGEQFLLPLSLPFIVRGFEQYPWVLNWADGSSYSSLVSEVLDFLRSCEGWVFLVRAGGVDIGCIWAKDFTGHGATIGGWADRKVHPVLNQKALLEFVKIAFAHNEDLQILRAETAPSNKAALRLLKNVGFSHPETRRGAAFANGELVTLTIVSITRQELEDKHGRLKDN